MSDSNKVATQATDADVIEVKKAIAWCRDTLSTDTGANEESREWLENIEQWLPALVARIESDRLALAEKEAEIQRLRGGLFLQISISDDVNVLGGGKVLRHYEPQGAPCRGYGCLTCDNIKLLDRASKGRDS